VLIELFYVFDWNTGETQSHGFILPRETFESLEQQLSQSGLARIAVQDEIQDFVFECRMAAERLEFRVRGSGQPYLPTPTSIMMTDYATVYNR